MQFANARQPLAAAAASLVMFCVCVASFMPPLSAHTLNSVPMIIVLGLGIAVSLILHLVFIGMAAWRLRRSPATWVCIALLTLPIGSIVGLILFEWFSEEKNQASSTH